MRLLIGKVSRHGLISTTVTCNYGIVMTTVSAISKLQRFETKRLLCCLQEIPNIVDQVKANTVTVKPTIILYLNACLHSVQTLAFSKVNYLK